MKTKLTIIEEIVHSLKKNIADSKRTLRAREIARGLAVAIHKDAVDSVDEIQQAFSIVDNNQADGSLYIFIRDEILHCLHKYNKENDSFQFDYEETIKNIDKELAQYMIDILEIDGVNNEERSFYVYLKDYIWENR